MIAPRVDYDGRRLVAGHGFHVPHRICLHDTESHDARGIRDLAGIATYWHGVPWGPGAHYGVDGEGYIARYLDDNEIGYHVQGRNTGSLGIEIVGFARWAPSIWLLRRAQREDVARLLAWLCERWEIPLRLHPEHGITTHAIQSRLYGGTHWDPGRYPVEQTIARAREISRTSPPARPKRPYTEADYWPWLRWTLAEGEYAGHKQADPLLRPAQLPERIPPTWLARRKRFLKRRAAARERDLATKE